MTLRVAFVMPGVGVVERGAEAFVVEICQALAQRTDFEVTLFSRAPSRRHEAKRPSASPAPGEPRDGGRPQTCRAPPGEIGEKVAWRRVRALDRDEPLLCRLYGSAQWVRKAMDTAFLDPLNVEWDTTALAALPGLWRDRFDVVVMEGGLVGGWLGRFLRRWRSTSFVDIAHGNSPKWEGAFARQRPDRVVAFTRAGAAMIQRLAPRARVTVIPHGVDLDLFRPDAPPVALALPRPVFLTAGAVDAHKRLHTVVEALSRSPGASLVVLGDGPEAAALDVLGLRLLGPDRYLRRQVPRESMAGWYCAADCFTLPSRSEAFGLVYLEAMACGLPCVAPDDEVRREVVAEAGLYCSVEDPDLYGRTLHQAVQRDWGVAPRRRAEAFSFHNTARAYAELLQEVASCRRS